MTQTITRLFNSHTEALEAISELKQSGVDDCDISLVGNNSEKWHEERSFSPRGDGDADTAAEGAAEGAGTGAMLGGALGGAGGLLAGLGLLAIPGIGPVAAAGWLGSTLIGAAAGAATGGVAGGLIGALTEAGVSKEDAEVYAEGVRRGGTLVAVRADDDEIAQVQAVFSSLGGSDAGMRGQQYREAGWSRFDESAEPYSRDQIERERGLYRS
ncbi:MAG: hypothetical protein ACXW3D_10625 [Caulobacteraceae bacterium]